ncbi:CCA tRNA nucleotidyltransferase [uncultured Slackia sp.]|uniref:CCA tRNA nucleotidyltransferase n=1 Tax=uncultured Slackia sp. TaxID=665903 RepID=UPI0026E01A11|nr:hypothetical protein [uncultured Slackia sp.]
MASMTDTAHIPVDPRALAVLRAIEAEGESAWFVGGCVRDALIGRTAHDFDIATSARWQRVRAIFQARGRRVIEAGAKHGSVGVVFDGLVVEITTYRIESSYSDGRRPDDVAFVNEVSLDLARRDFCMNAIAYHPERGLCDPFAGRSDIEAGVVRAVGDARARFEEDPLRILRAVRFCAQLGFEASERTREAILEGAGDIRRVAKERVFAELEKTLVAPAPGGVIAQYAPVIEEIVPGFPNKDANNIDDRRRSLERTAGTMDAVPARAELRFAALLADMEKTWGNGIARSSLKALKAPRKLIDRVCALLDAIDEKASACPLHIRLLAAAHGGDLDFVRELTTLQQALGADDDAEDGRSTRIQEAIDEVERYASALKRSDLAIGGGDLIQAGMAPGPAVAAMLDALLLEVIQGTVDNERTALLERAMGGNLPCEPAAENIFKKVLKRELTNQAKHRNIQTRA